MLDAIRSNTQSFGVKLAFGVIILVFVFWGVGSFTDGDTSRVMASVNGESILEPQFYKRYQTIEQQLMQRGMTREQMKTQHLGRQVLQDMIAHTLVRQEAERINLAVTPLELRKAIEQNPLFHNDKGVLDKDSYMRGLSALRLSVGEFEQQMREELLYEKMLEMVSAPVWIAPDAARNRYNFLFEKRVFDYVFVSAKDFLAKVSVSKDEIEAYYKEHPSEFTVPGKAELTFIRLSPEKLVNPAGISEADAKKWYEANSRRYSVHEAVRCAHILVPLTEQATEKENEEAKRKIAEIQTALAKGTPFAELADKYNQTGAAQKGGELGWIERGVTVEPFEKVLFALEAGRVSEPVQTRFGLHLILAHEKRPESVRPFEEVKAEVRTNMAKELGRDKQSEVGESLLEDNLLGRDLSESARRFGLMAEKSGKLSAEELVSKMSFSPEDASLLLSGTPVDTLMQAGDDVLVVRVDSIDQQSVKPLDAVREEITKKLTVEKGLAEAMKEAKALQRELAEGTLSSEKQKALSKGTSEACERSDAISPFNRDLNLSRACFHAKLGTWLPSPFAVTKKDGEKGAALFRVHSISPAQADDWDRIHTILESGYARDAADNLRNLFFNELMKKSKISNVNFEKADRMDG